jgi:hypothetical protein
MAAKKKAKKQKKRVTREDPVRAHAKRRAAMEVSLESVKEALDRYADLGHEPGAHLLATSMEEWRSAVAGAARKLIQIAGRKLIHPAV